MAEPLKVIMMGGRRCGKTSALASLFDQMVNGPVKDYFTVSDRTVLETKGFETQDSLNDKTLELINKLETNAGNSSLFLVDNSPTYNVWHYNLRLQVPGKKREMDIEFCDIPGEYFENSKEESKQQFKEETEALIKASDVFVIVVDTPYLMGSIEETTKDICPDSINLGTNRVKEIQNFLTNIDNKDGKDAKMVIFVPLKCEKWAKEPNGLNRVTARLKEVYGTHICNLSAFEKMNISIIPMQTSGNIIFSEFKKAFIYNSIEGPVRCCKIDDETIRKENGENDLPMPGETVVEDPQSVIAGTTMLRPYAWYRINQYDSSFTPKNCDQLPLHIIRFMLTKLMDAEASVRHGGLLGGIYDFFKDVINSIRKRFGTMDTEELKQIIGNMQRNGVIKDTGDGIEIIKRF